MANVVLMPKVGISVETCIITEWLKQPGDTVAVGDILFTYETDKASVECESTEAGTLIEQFYGNGDEVEVLTPVCAIGEAGEDVSALRPGGAAAEAPAAPTAPAEKPVEAAQAPAPVAEQPVPAAPVQGDIKISPRARRLAEEKYVDAHYATPTGPYGRVIERDVRELLNSGVGVMTGAAAAAGVSGESGSAIGGRVGAADAAAVPVAGVAPAASFATDGPGYRDVAFSGPRKVISRSMTASLTTIPQLTHNFSFDASDILALRKKLKASAEEKGLPNITLNDFVLYAVSRLLLKYPELNAHMVDGTTIRYFDDVHLAMAVDTPRGLLVPVIKYANRKSLAQIATEAKTLAKQAQEGGINPDDLSGGTFTISNLGGFGVESFTPVINLPQTGILGVDNIVERPRTGADGNIELYPAMGISLTYDHRAIDGAPASRFASELCAALADFSGMLTMQAITG